MAAAIAPSSNWLQGRGNHQDKTVTVSDAHPMQHSSAKRRKVRFTHQFHRLTRALLPFSSGSRPTSQVGGSSQYRSPSPFPRDRLVEEVDTPEEQPEIPEGATQYEVQGEPLRPASRESSPSSMWGPPVAFLSEARQSHSSSRPTSQGVQARREVKVTAPPTSEEQPQSVMIEKMPPTAISDKTSLFVDTRALEVDNNSEEEDTAAHEAALIRSLNPYSLNETSVINFSRPLQFLGVNCDGISFHSASLYGSNTRHLSSCGWIQSNDCTPSKESAANKGWLPVPRQRCSVLHSNESCASFGVRSSTTINTREVSLLRRAAVSDSQNRTGYNTWTPQTSQRVFPSSSSPSALGSSSPGNADFVKSEERNKNPFADPDLDLTTSKPSSPLTYSEIVAVNEGRPQATPYLPRQDSMSSSIMSIPISRESFELPPPAIPITCPVPLHVPANRLSKLIVEDQEDEQDQPEPDGGKPKWRRSRSFFKRWSFLKTKKEGPSR